MQEKPKRSRKFAFIFLFLGLFIGLILVAVVSLITLYSMGSIFTFDNLVSLHLANPVFLFFDLLVLVGVLLFTWVGREKDQVKDARNQAEWLAQNHQVEFQQVQVEQDKKHQEEILQLKTQLEEQGKKFLDLETIIRRGKQQWEGTFDAVSDLIIITDEAGRILRCNRATGQFLQVGYSQIIGRGINDLFANGADNPSEAIPGEKKQMKAPNSEAWYEISKSHLLIDGKQEGWVYIFQNITPQKQALLEQQRLTHYYELLVNNNPLAIVTLNLEDRIIDCNPAFEKLFYYSKRESLGWKADLLVSPPDMVQENQRMSEAVHRGETVHKVTQRRRKDGSLLDVEVFWIPVVLGGRQFGSLGLYHDVTDFVRSQKVEQEEVEQVEQVPGEAARVMIAKFVEDAFTSHSAPEETAPEPEPIEEVEAILPESTAALGEEVPAEVEAIPLETPELEEEVSAEGEAVPAENAAFEEVEVIEEEPAIELQPVEEGEGASPVRVFRKRLIPVEDIEGIGPVYAQKLLEVGVKTTQDLLDQGKTRKGREELIEKTGISSTLVLKWVNMADLMRIHGIGEEYSELLEKAGVDTVKELRNRNPKNLYEAMFQANAAHKLVRRPPHLSEVESWVKEAKELEPVLTY